MTLTGLEKYHLTAQEALKFQAEFTLILPSVNLVSIDLKYPALLELSVKQGVYFWLMRVEDNIYKVYAGKTKSLPRRLKDYSNGFQLHAPNDFKLQFFYTFMLTHYSDAKFDLYFVSDAYHTEKENEVLQKFTPIIINERDRVSKEDRDEVKNAFSKYYSSSFNAKLTEIVATQKHISLAKILPFNPNKETVMTNHDMMASALKRYSGKEFSTGEIWNILHSAYPDFDKGSFLPNDHGEGNKSCCACAGTESRIFDRIGRGTYRVR